MAALVAGLAACAAAPPPAPLQPASISTSLGVRLEEYVRTPEGLYWKDVEVGTGAAAAVNSRVNVAYRGVLANGVPFDSSGNLAVRLSQDPVIKGWKLGIPGMKAGGARVLVIPPELGYGGRGVGAIPPNSTLIFRVQLIRVQ